MIYLTIPYRTQPRQQEVLSRLLGEYRIDSGTVLEWTLRHWFDLDGSTEEALTAIESSLQQHPRLHRWTYEQYQSALTDLYSAMGHNYAALEPFLRPWVDQVQALCQLELRRWLRNAFVVALMSSVYETNQLPHHPYRSTHAPALARLSTEQRIALARRAYAHAHRRVLPESVAASPAALLDSALGRWSRASAAAGIDADGSAA